MLPLFAEHVRVVRPSVVAQQVEELDLVAMAESPPADRLLVVSVYIAVYRLKCTTNGDATDGARSDRAVF
jgi:hypothetical protein